MMPQRKTPWFSMFFPNPSSPLQQKRWEAVLVAVLLFACLVPLSAAQNVSDVQGEAAATEDAATQDRRMLWEIRSDTGTVGYLVGSVHLMKPDIYPLGAAFDDAFAESDVVAFEVNLDSIQTQAPTLFPQLGMYAGNKTLEDALSADTFAMLQATTDSLGIPLARLQRMEPWVVSMTLPALLYQQAGYSPQSGIDIHFFERAKEAGKPVRALETLEEQLRIFDDLSPEMQENLLRQSLQDAGRTVQMMDEMADAWTHGDIERLETMLNEEMQQDFPMLYRRLLVDRNENWMPQIESMIENNDRPMIVVGAGHMAGPNGLIALLEAQGYTVEQR